MELVLQVSPDESREPGENSELPPRNSPRPKCFGSGENSSIWTRFVHFSEGEHGR